MLSKKQIVYAIGGVLSYGVKLGITVLFAQVVGFSAVLSYVIAIVLNVLFTYAYNHFWTFEAKGKFATRLRDYLLVLLGAYALDVAIMAGLTSLGVDYRISLTISTGVLFVLKYFLFDNFVFS